MEIDITDIAVNGKNIEITGWRDTADGHRCCSIIRIPIARIRELLAELDEEGTQCK